MDHVTLSAHVIHPLLRVLRAARIAPVAAMPASDLRSKAYGLSYAILASLWLRRKGEPSWKDVYEAWDQHSLPADEPDPSLYGQFHPDDHFELLTNNRDAFVERGHLLKNARHSVDVATYYIQADETGWKTAHQLAECARRGVRVRMDARFFTRFPGVFRCYPYLQPHLRRSLRPQRFAASEPTALRARLIRTRPFPH